MKMMLRFLAVAAVVQGSIAVLIKTRPFTQDDQEVVKVVEPDVVAELPEEHRSIALAAKTKKHKHAEVPFAEENKEEIVRVVDPDIVPDLAEKHSSMALASKTKSKSRAKVNVAQEDDDKEEIVKVVEPDIVTDLKEKPSSMALATKTSRKSHKEAPFAEQEDPDVVRVVEADVVSDGSDGKAMPTKSLVQHTAKASVVESDASGSDAEENTVKTVEADVVQDADAKEQVDTNDDKKMNAKIEFADQRDEDVVMTVDFNKVQPDDAKGNVTKSGVADAAKPKANVTSVAHENNSSVTAHPATKKLSTLSVKRRLRGPFVDDNGEEYVEPSKVVSPNKEEEYVKAASPNMEEETIEVDNHRPQVASVTSGTEVEADVVEPPKIVDDSPKVPQVIYDDEKAPEETDTEEQSVVKDAAKNHEEVQEVHETEAQRRKRECDEGSEFNNNDC